MPLRLPPPTRAVAVTLAAVTVCLAVATWLHSYDDAYITYTYARNLAEGRGLSWNGEPGLGTTAPLLASTLALLQVALPLGIPIWGHLLSWLAVGATGLALFELGRREGWPRTGALAALGWCLSPVVMPLLGSEHLPGIALAAAAALALEARRWPAAGLCLGLAVGLRSELGLAAVLLALAALAGGDGPRAALRGVVHTAAVALAAWGAWLGLLWLLAGSVVPLTLDAKRAVAAGPLLGEPRVLERAWEQAHAYFYPFWPALLIALAIAGAAVLGANVLAPARRRWRYGAALVVWGFLHLGVVAALDVHYAARYLLPTHWSLLLLAAFAAELPALRRRRPLWLRGLGWTCAAGFLAFVLANGLDRARRFWNSPQDQREVSYRRLAEWISERYPPGVRLGALEVGYLGYHGDFVTVDLLGLTNADVPLDALREGDLARVVHAMELDLLMVPSSMTGLAGRLVGDPAQLLRSFELDHLQLDSHPAILLYRRGDLRGRGEVYLDLLAARAVRDRQPPLAMVRRGAFAAPVARLRPGQAWSTRVQLRPDARLFAAVSAESQRPVAVRVEVGERGAALSATGRVGPRNGGWEPLSLRLDPAASGQRARLRLTCLRESAGDCLVALPALTRPSPPRRTAEPTPP